MRISRLALCLSVLLPFVTSAQVPQELYGGMKWRLIGPFRGGRSIAVAGSQSRPKEYYFGATGGGVWKTVNGGEDWSCVSDGFFKTASVGAVAVAPSNPDVVYAGMGERDIRGNISEGDGVYKSTDGGKSWRNVGLESTQTISKIVIDPRNPEIVYVAALGHVYGPNPERGVFKSTDGGRTWDKVLFKSDKAGAVDLCLDPNNSEVLYAALWEAWRTPYALNSGGPGSGLYKSVDAGKTWTEITRNPGLPEGVIGKIGVAVSPADSNRVYAIVEAKDGGIYSSDDAGKTWKLVNDDSEWRQRAWYFSHVIADPKNKDGVYVLNVSNGRSTDGGKTFRGMGSPHSDNHDLWIAPDDPNRMIESNDGGANVSTDGGRSWTEQDIPTAQFYHVAADTAFPYHLLGAQQDNSAVRIASRTFGAGIGRADWTSTAGGESGYITPDPKDPDVVFGGSYGGDLSMINHRTGERRAVDPWPDNPMGHGAIDLKERFQWTFPIVFSPNDPKVLYTSSQHLFKTTNGGQTWKQISPDLTRNDPSTLQATGGPITKDNTSVEYYGTIFTVAESPVKRGVIWTGSDDGLVYVTRDAGRSWKEVTPKGMPKWGLCSMVEASPHDAGTAYLAVDNHENDDLKPYAYKTTDYGATWTPIVSGIPQGAFLRVVREDTVQKGLLFAGTERGVFISFDQGGRWQPLQLNLPVCPVHDLIIKNDDLIAATHGRAFWAMDNIAPLRQVAGASALNAILFTPKDPLRLSGGGRGFGGGRGRGGAAAPAENMGDNPMSGIVVDYYLPKDVSAVKFEYFDSKGTLLRTESSAPASAGFHRVSTGNFSYPGYKGIPGMVLWTGGPRPIPAPPGEYTVKITAGDFSDQKKFHLRPDPRSSASEADLVAQFELAQRISARCGEANAAVLQIIDMNKQIDAAVAKDSALKESGEALKAKLLAVEEAIFQYRSKSGEDPLNFPIKLNDKLNGVLGTVLGGEFRPTDQCYAVFEVLSKELQLQLDMLASIQSSDWQAFKKRIPPS